MTERGLKNINVFIQRLQTFFFNFVTFFTFLNFFFLERFLHLWGHRYGLRGKLKSSQVKSTRAYVTDEQAWSSPDSTAGLETLFSKYLSRFRS